MHNIALWDLRLSNPHTNADTVRTPRGYLVSAQTPEAANKPGKAATPLRKPAALRARHFFSFFVCARSLPLPINQNSHITKDTFRPQTSHGRLGSPSRSASVELYEPQHTSIHR